MSLISVTLWPSSSRSLGSFLVEHLVDGDRGTILNMNLTTSAALTGICWASSETVMVADGHVTDDWTGRVLEAVLVTLLQLALATTTDGRRRSLHRWYAGTWRWSLSFSLTLTLIDTRGASPRRRSSSRVRLSLRRVSSSSLGTGLQRRLRSWRVGDDRAGTAAQAPLWRGRRWAAAAVSAMSGVPVLRCAGELRPRPCRAHFRPAALPATLLLSLVSSGLRC